jgi:hypothetical protein
MFRLSPPVTGALALVLASALVYVAGIAAASANPSSSPDAGPVIVQGILYDVDGSPASAGELVTLTAWPTSQVLAGLAKGDPVPTLTAGVAVTDASGAFALRYSDPAALAPFVDADGTVDFSVESDAGRGPHSFNFSRKVARDAVQSTAVAPVDRKGAVVIKLRPLPGVLAQPAAGERSASTLNYRPPCGWHKVSTLGPRWVNIASAYTAGGVSAKLTYVSGASSSIGVGISVPGSGTFSASGSVTVSSGATIGFPAVSGGAGRVWRTQFVFAKFGYRCATAPYSSYKVQAVSFAGGASFTTPKVPPTAKWCVIKLANTHYILDESTATSYTASTSGDIGINLKVTTGYSSSTKIRFDFTSGKRLCGTNGYPGETPGRLVAKV